MIPSIKIITGDALTSLRELPDESIDCCVTSPPYWGLRDYGIDGQIGLEETPSAYVERLCAVFGEVRRVLSARGTLWLNLGDSYAGSGKGIGDTKTNNKSNGASRDVRMGSAHGESGHTSGVTPPKGWKAKDLMGIPWRVAFALQSDGWYLRSDIIWAKPNCMPESVTDRPTRSHEYIFLLTKSRKYFYDAEAIAEPLAYGSINRLSQDVDSQQGSDRVPGKTNGSMKAVYREPYRGTSDKDYKSAKAQDANATKARIVDRILSGEIVTRNKRDVWTVAPANYKGAHFATFPPDLIKPCVLAGCPAGGTVLDPFAGSGTTGQVAMELGRNFVGIELNPTYVKLINKRLLEAQPGFAFGEPEPSVIEMELFATAK